MNESKVFFTDFHTTPQENIFVKLERLLKEAGIKNILSDNKTVALKIHFGEPGNISYIRPQYVSKIVDMVKESGGLPFLTDTNTLYKGKRSNAVDHLHSAMINGFTPLATGCNVIIADGLRGTEYREIETGLPNVPSAKIGSAIADADILISINHFKGHELTGIGGCLKNISMGCASVQGKLQMHSDSPPEVRRENCKGCSTCVDNCAYNAIKLDEENIADINYSLCAGCGQCIAMCIYDAVKPNWNTTGKTQEKMMEYAFAVLKNKPSFHINFISDVSPNCDCWHYNDVPIVQNIGILASSDPAAIDKACADLVNAAPVNPNSVIGSSCKQGDDKFKLLHPETDWRKGVEYAEKLGIGSSQYELIKL